MTTVRKVLGRLPMLIGDWDSNYRESQGYLKNNRVLIFNSELQSKIDNNTYAPATQNAQTGVITFDTTHWTVISDGRETIGLGTASKKDVPSSGNNASTTQVVMGDDTRLSDARTANGGNSATVNGHTVLTDVPANALFTDTDTKVTSVDNHYQQTTKPTQTTSGLYKMKIDAAGHITESVAVQKSDITSLGIPSGDTHHDGSVTATSGYALTKVQVDSDGTWSKEDVAIPTKSDFTGSIESGNTGFVTGGDAYTELNKKVDKVQGKGLSTNDYDDTAKGKVDNIPSSPKYTDTTYQFEQSGNTLKMGTNNGTKSNIYTPSVPSVASTSSLLKGDGNGNAVAATEGTDYQAPLSFKTTPSSSNKVVTESDIEDFTEGDGTYPDMTVGKSQNIFGSTQTNDTFVYRPTAGIQDIQSGQPGLGGAEVQKIEGNGVAWNQLVPDGYSGWYAIECTYSISNNVVSLSGNSLDGEHYFETRNLQSIVNHVYYVSVMQKTPTLDVSIYDKRLFFIGGNEVYLWSTQVNVWNKLSAIITSSSDAFNIARFYVPQNTTIEYCYPQVIDLTLLFGAGNEPSTVAEFETWLANNVGLKDYYPYCAGELIGVKSISVKTTGFNQLQLTGRTEYINTTNPTDIFDFLSESTLIKGFSPDGYIRYVTVDGYSIENNSVTVRTSDDKSSYAYGIGFCIKVLPSTSYYFTSNVQGGTVGVTFFDKAGHLLSYQEGVIGTFLSPSNAYWCVITFKPGDINTEMTWTDICINLHHSGSRDGEYEPYWSEEKEIDVTTLTGKLNGAGNSVTVFPDGLKSAGNVHDEIVKSGGVTKAIKKVGVVGLGTVEWLLIDSNNFGTQNFIDYKFTDDNTANYLCNRYISIPHRDRYRDKSVFLNEDKRVIITDSSYSDATVFQAAMNGAMLYYELATPEEYIIDNLDMPVEYSVDDYGTEELLLDNGTTITECAPKMTIKYGINAADAIKNLPHNYVSVKAQSLSSSEKAQVRANIGLGNVDNTADVDKSVANADTVDGYHADTFMNNTMYSGNIDTLIKAGSYRLDNNNAGTYPTGAGANYAQLLVLHGDGDTYAQMYFPYGYSAAYVRTASGYVGSTLNWHDWERLATISDIPSSLPANGGNSSTVNGHTVNSDVPANAVFTDTNTWRPLGTGSNDACAGNDSRLSDARKASNIISNYYTVSSNQANIATSLTVDGCENKIYYNSGSSDITLAITTSTDVIAVDGNTSLTLGAGKYAEINFIRKTISDTAKVFIRSVSQ